MTVRRRRILALAAAAPIAFTLVGASASVASADSHKAEHNKHLAPAAASAAASPTASAAANPYAPSGVGSGTPQGNGHAPANGTVGKADNKNPPGQAPNGSDHNNGYECDGNHGVGDKGGNPAHSGCSSTTPTKSPSPSPSTSPPKTKLPSPSASPPHTISGSPSAPAVCTSGPCYHPPVCQTKCLPYTGMNVRQTAAIGGEGVLAGVMILLLANLQTQVKKYRSMPVR